jgi:hypothetical protein
MGGVYDAKNNTVWTTNGDYVDMWINPGHLPTWKIQDIRACQGMTDGFTDEDDLEVRDSIQHILQHVAILSIHFVNGDSVDADIGFNQTALNSLLKLTFQYLRSFAATDIQAVLLILKVQLLLVVSFCCIDCMKVNFITLM